MKTCLRLRPFHRVTSSHSLFRPRFFFSSIPLPLIPTDPFPHLVCRPGVALTNSYLHPSRPGLIPNGSAIGLDSPNLPKRLGFQAFVPLFSRTSRLTGKIICAVCDFSSVAQLSSAFGNATSNLLHGLPNDLNRKLVVS